MNESYFEKLLNIDTIKAESRMDWNKHYNRYEPTPYDVLEKLFEHYIIKEEDNFVDFGSGKGRFSFYVNCFFKCGSTGVEISRDFHEKALSNLDCYGKKHSKNCKKIKFVLGSAEEYKIDRKDNKFYFFNPFSVNIFIKVLNNIIRSYEENSRQIDVILYYPDDDYIKYIEERTAFNLLMDVYINPLCKDYRERIAIYRLGDDCCRMGDLYYDFNIPNNTIPSL